MALALGLQNIQFIIFGLNVRRPRFIRPAERWLCRVRTPEIIYYVWMVSWVGCKTWLHWHFALKDSTEIALTYLTKQKFIGHADISGGVGGAGGCLVFDFQLNQINLQPSLFSIHLKSVQLVFSIESDVGEGLWLNENLDWTFWHFHYPAFPQFSTEPVIYNISTDTVTAHSCLPPCLIFCLTLNSAVWPS